MGETGFLTGVSILRITSGSQVLFAYFELTAAQRAYWRGERKLASYEFVVGSNPCDHAAENLKATRNANQVQFTWNKVPGAYGYVIWVSQKGSVYNPLGSSYETKFAASVTGPAKWYVKSDFDQCLRSTSAIASIH